MEHAVEVAGSVKTSCPQRSALVEHQRSGGAEHALKLQRTVGNQAVLRLLAQQDRSHEQESGPTDLASSPLTAPPPVVSQVLATPGRPLADSVRRTLEPRFGFDLSGIRVHSDEAAARSAQLVGAQAYAIGQHIVFGAGRYEPASHRGQALLAHELAHTIQQRDAGDLRASDGLRRSNSKEEIEAERAAGS